MTCFHYLARIFTMLTYGILMHFNYLPPCHSYFFSPEIRICDATHLRKYRKNFCTSKLVFTENQTKLNSDCICVSGIWVIINRDCIPSTLVGNDGCILTPEIKAMQYLGALRKDDFFAVTTLSEINMSFDLLRPVRNVIVSGHIWLFNGILFKSNGSYCAEKWHFGGNRKRKHRNEVARYIVDGKLTVQYECSPFYTNEMTANLRYKITDLETSECAINCTKRPASKLVIKHEPVTTEISKPLHDERKNNEKNYKDSVNDDLDKSSIEENAIPSVVKSLVHHLHRRLLIKIMAYGFNKKQYWLDSRPEYIPQSSFRVLEKLQELVWKTCSGRVPKMFLELAYVMFRVAYENRGTDILEYLTKQEETDIMQFLNECHDSITPLIFNDNPFCPNELIKTVKLGDKYVTVNVTGNYTDNFYFEHRHLAMEIPWNMLDLTLAMCINAFAESYILYHKMEQAVEKLFIKDLKILWQYPPENGVLYTRIYGPHWKHYAENLERCVQSVYIHNPKLARLLRPGGMGLLSRVRSKLGSGNDHIDHLVDNVPIKIPEISVGKRDPGLTDPKTVKTQSILKSVDLNCRPLNAPQCYFE